MPKTLEEKKADMTLNELALRATFLSCVDELLTAINVIGVLAEQAERSGLFSLASRADRLRERVRTVVEEEVKRGDE